jgi:hypothetical protein
LWNFIILTPERKEYFYALKDFSSYSHTADFLFKQIEEIIKEIGAEKILAVVSDNAANCTAARRLISEKYNHVFNVRCIAHCLNLMSHDIISHSFAHKLIKYCNVLARFFKKSTVAG